MKSSLNFKVLDGIAGSAEYLWAGDRRAEIGEILLLGALRAGQELQSSAFREEAVWNNVREYLLTDVHFAKSYHPHTQAVHIMETGNDV